MKLKNAKLEKKVMAILCTAALVGTMGLAGCSSSDDSSSDSSYDGETTTIRQAVMTGNLDYYVAKIGVEQGIFEDYGIDLEVTEYAYGVNTVDAVVNETADIGNMADYALVNRFGNVEGSSDLVFFSELSDSSTDGGLYVAFEYADDLDSLDGSIGFITPNGTVWEYYNSKIIEYLGFDEDEQNLVVTDSASAAISIVQNGEASAYYISGADAQRVENQGWEKVLTTEELGISTRAYYVANQSFLEEDEDAVGRWLEATQATAEWIDENLDEAAEIMESDTGIEADEFEADWNKQTIAVGISQEGIDDLEELQTWCADNGKYENSYELTDYLYTDLLENVMPDTVTYEAD